MKISNPTNDAEEKVKNGTSVQLPGGDLRRVAGHFSLGVLRLCGRDALRARVRPRTLWLHSKPQNDKGTQEGEKLIAREEDSLYELTPVSKRSRRWKTFKASDDMDTDSNLSDADYVTDLASKEYESLLEADFKQVAANPLTGSLSPSSPKK
ncbi:hypothetical protein TNIN_270061 [Trichonephila inaurata madagascariensis]|uniref:Uncharacterized protein n=1 Tax=Trichonephila inaurata madagascariensis TaxID=2747483 RepID=A0A8X6XZV4_9ARAC|nr:hypothetical protein TNIN_270061 [Trichonephila inaurata madagascariensis]